MQGKKPVFKSKTSRCTAAQSPSHSHPPRTHPAGTRSVQNRCHCTIPLPPEDRQGSNDSSSIQVTLRFGASPGYPYAPQKADKQQQLKAEPHYDD
jgi:hypothetical protein